MLQFERWKIWTISLLCALGLVYAAPNVMPQSWREALPSWWPKETVNLGLDLRGGSYLLLRADVDGLKDTWLKNLEADVRKLLRAEKIGYSALGRAGGGVRVRLLKPEDKDRALTALKTLVEQVGGSVFTGQVSYNLSITEESDGSILVSPTEAALTERVRSGMTALIETVRRRIDQLGTKEPLVQRQGFDRIVVQVPGFDDPKQLKDVLDKTAKLSFHEVDLSMTPSEARERGVPPGSRIYPSTDGTGDYLLKENEVVAGDELVDAQPSFDGQTSEPVVSFRFNTSGARKFGKFTQEHVDLPFAIVLDDKVISAPRIISPILGGSGQITGHFTVESANNLAILLRSGALPTSLTIEEERTVGATLGSDSIEAGRIAALIGTLAVIFFMILAYGTFGLFASLALIVNGILLFGIMTAMQSALTLPGIAGLVLTLGMAVDANVLVFERIREELRAGKTAIRAIESGFSRAIVTIVDSQLTTLFAGIIMFWLGSGPIRGFAVTLSIGIFTTIFTAVTVTRLIIAVWLRWANKRQRHIVVPI
ncbi:MAG: protein translocase subunit SecD [Hyphomicrobiaceae bacterium]